MSERAVYCKDDAPVPKNAIFPLKKCVYDNDEYPCPNMATSLLRYEFGPSWDVPKAKYGKSTETRPEWYCASETGWFNGDGMWVFNTD